MNFWLSAAAAAAGGLLYASPFFPHSAEWVSQIAAFIGLAALLFSLREETSWKKASLLGFIFGLFAFTPGLSWLYQSLHDFGGLPALLSGAALLLMGAANSIFTALTAAAVSKVRPGPLRAAAAFPAAFVFFDWIRGPRSAPSPGFPSGTFRPEPRLRDLLRSEAFMPLNSPPRSRLDSSSQPCFCGEARSGNAPASLPQPRFWFPGRRCVRSAGPLPENRFLSASYSQTCRSPDFPALNPYLSLRGSPARCGFPLLRDARSQTARSSSGPNLLSTHPFSA